jgi:aldehyde oxidoreductase
MSAEQACDVALTLTVNGHPHTLTAPPFQSLADTLRGLSDGAGGFLIGTKIGCDAGDCGACTVLLDGAQVCACLVPSAQANGRAIETVESVPPRLAAAFARHGAAQCGICTPGMVQAARAVLAQYPAPTRLQVQQAIGGVLCRCTGYVKIIDAILDGARDFTPPAPNSRHHPAVGQSMLRVDGDAKIAGREIFGADSAPATALWMRVIRSPHVSASFELGALDVFKHRHNLTAVLTAADVPGANSFGIFPNTKDQPVFAERHVRFRGEAVAALVGTRACLDRIDTDSFPVVWRPMVGISGTDAALASGVASIHATHPDNVLTRGNLKTGDAAAALQTAAAIAEGHFETGFVEHAYIEPEAGYAERVGDTITVTASTQAPYMDREDVARVLGIPEAQVIIAPTACGGGFGGKLDVAVQPLLAVAAWTLKQPVRIVYTRTESMASTTKRHPSRIWAKASADRNGRLTSYEMRGDFNTGAYASWGPTVANRVPIHAHGPYKIPNVHNQTRAIFTNDTPAGAFRGFGVPQSAIANETLMDDLAEKLDLDRWQIRRNNALARGDATASGQVLHDSAGLPQCLDALKPTWDQALIDVRVHNSSNIRYRRGVGIACMWYGCGNTALPNPSAMRVTLNRAGLVTVWSGAVDIGQGVSTILLQIVRDSLAINDIAIRLTDEVGNTAVTLDAGKTSASRQTLVSGNAARLAALDLRRQLERLANVAVDAPMQWRGGQLAIGRDGERRLDLTAMSVETARAADPADLFLIGYGRYDPPTTPLDSNSQGAPYATYGFAAQIAEVLVDTKLGTTKVLHLHAAHDVGRAINPMLVEGQIHGGIAQGLGLALMEEFIPGRTENLHDYLIPTAGDIPPITTYLIEDPEPEGPFGAKGVGEPALVATAPAILSAIRDATAVTIRKVPVLPHRLWEAL